MTAALALVLAVLAQEGEVARQAARITAKDPRASLDAVSRLVDLAATSREAVASAASKLPDELSFYRTALQEELKAREGAPRLKRASFDAADRAPNAILNEIAAKFGETIDLNNLNRGGAAAVPGPATITLKMENVSYMEALEAVCRQAKVGITLNGMQVFINPFQEHLGASAYRNYIVLLPFVTRSRRIEFGAGETRSLRLTMQLLWDSEGGVVRVGRAQVVEAVDEKGKAVEALPEEPAPPEPARKEGDPVWNYASRWNQGEIALKIPEAGKIARLRGFYEVEGSREASAFEFADLTKDEKKADDHYEVETLRKGAGGNALIELRVKPKGPIEAFLKMPLEVRAWVADGRETPLYVQGSLKDGRVEYHFPQMSHYLGNAVAIKTVKVRVHRSLVPRRIPFEFADLPVQ